MRVTANLYASPTAGAKSEWEGQRSIRRVAQRTQRAKQAFEGRDGRVRVPEVPSSVHNTSSRVALIMHSLLQPRAQTFDALARTRYVRRFHACAIRAH